MFIVVVCLFVCLCCCYSLCVVAYVVFFVLFLQASLPFCASAGSQCAGPRAGAYEFEYWESPKLNRVIIMRKEARHSEEKTFGGSRLCRYRSLPLSSSLLSLSLS